MDGEFYSKTICLLSTRPPPPSSLLTPDSWPPGCPGDRPMPARRGWRRCWGWCSRVHCEQRSDMAQPGDLQAAQRNNLNSFISVFISFDLWNGVYHFLLLIGIKYCMKWKYLKQPPESHSSRGDAISLDADSLSLYFRYINSAQVNWHTTCHIRRGEVCPWCDVQFADPPHCRISPTSDQDFDDDFSLWNYLFLLIMEKLSVTLPLIEGLWSYPTQCSAV